MVCAGLDKFTLYENDFKNLKNHGPSKFELDSSMWLIAYLKEYLRDSLAELIPLSLKHQQRTYCDISRQNRTLLS